MLLGVNGVAIISHGSAGPTAILNACRVAKDMVERELVAELTSSGRLLDLITLQLPLVVFW